MKSRKSFSQNDSLAKSIASSNWCPRNEHCCDQVFTVNLCQFITIVTPDDARSSKPPPEYYSEPIQCHCNDSIQFDRTCIQIGFLKTMTQSSELESVKMIEVGTNGFGSVDGCVRWRWTLNARNGILKRIIRSSWLVVEFIFFGSGLVAPCVLDDRAVNRCSYSSHFRLCIRSGSINILSSGGLLVFLCYLEPISWIFQDFWTRGLVN